MSNTEHNYNKFQEALRLINKFFPETKGIFSKENGVNVHNFINSMRLCDLKLDVSCDPFGMPSEPNLGLNRKGGFRGEYDIIFERLLEHANFSPIGRCVLILDIIPKIHWSAYSILPIVCDSKKVSERINEFNSSDFFMGTSFDTLFVYESGEAMLIDHDNRFYWAKSLRNTFKHH